MAGILYGIGVGPGDPELITVKAVKRIMGCELIGIPAKEPASCTAYKIAKGAVAGLEKKPVVAVPVPMTSDTEKLLKAYDAGSGRMIKELREGKDIAFLNLGDPTVYGSYMELHERVRKAGCKAEIISGVPSFCAAAAELSVPLGSRREQIHILPGLYCTEELGQYSGTRILMKSGGQVREIKEKLLKLEEGGRAKVYAVINCGMENQAVYQEIGELPEEAGYFTTIIVKEVCKE